MSVTNAISGLTAAGGLLCLGGGVFPHSMAQFLASVAVIVSSVNIAGGFIVSKRMLDMFKRKTDAPEYNYMFGASGLAMMGSLYAAHSAGVPHIYTMGYLASSLCAIGSICGLAN
jgi:NAD(P) transhydrogenase